MQTIKVLSVAGLALLTSTTAFAHPGSHYDLGNWQSLAHFLTSPYHLIGLVVLAGVITGFAIWHARRGS
ncbi:MAG TPA: hypothetical protein PLM98_01645 [Thiolinea sp.]|nr:hypothetical protein [Thiolinea sp.]